MKVPSRAFVIVGVALLCASAGWVAGGAAASGIGLLAALAGCAAVLFTQGAQASASAQRTGRSDGVGDELNAAASELGSAAIAVSVTSDSLEEGAEKVAVQARQLAAAAAHVSAEMGSVSTSAEEMSASIKEMAGTSSTAARASAAASERAQAIDAAVKQLSRSAAGIDSVVKAIATIASQTNLLALNATIEAARAGAAGRGFGVVASEVKELARQTAKATEDAGRQISEVQEGAQAAAAGLAEVSKLIADIANLQHTVASAVEEQAATTSEMSRSIASSARAAEEMTGAMTHLAEAAHVTSGGARTVKDLGEQISQPSANLRRLARRLGARQHESPKTGLDAAFFDKSIRAHIAWRTRLLIAIHGGEVPDRAKAADPSACALGQWLGKAGAQLGGLPDFAALVELHRTFHAQVGEALTAIAAGKAEEAQQLVISGPLSRTSRGTVALLQRLRPAGPGEDDSGLPAWSAALATGQPTVDS
jgi:hypothetical protein